MAGGGMSMDQAPSRPATSVDEVWPALLGLTGFATLTLLALTEHFGELPAAAAAYLAAWRISRT
jgi:hypothetical protein